MLEAIVVISALALWHQFTAVPPPQILVVGEKIVRIQGDTAEVCVPSGGRLVCGDSKVAQQ